MSAVYKRTITTFLRVAAAGSFNKAAQSANLTAAAVIKQINQLEGELRFPLFHRTHRGLVLTEAGRIFADEMKTVTEAADRAVRRAQKTANPDPVIHVGTSPMTPAGFLMPLWPEVHAAEPDLELQMVPFENTRENARQILANLGDTIDVVPGIFDERLLELRRCSATELTRVTFGVAVSLTHPLAQKTRLTVADLAGEHLYLMRPGWSSSIDALRTWLTAHHPEISLEDFDFYSLSVFNQSQQKDAVLLAVPYWKTTHPLLKIIPVDWAFTIPFGFLHAPLPSLKVERFLKAVKAAARDGEF